MFICSSLYFTSRFNLIEMEKQIPTWVLQSLCSYDKNNPDYIKLEDEDERKPRANCYCDNCFYGRDKLALEVINLISDYNNKN